jgi:hypothetical protein
MDVASAALCPKCSEMMFSADMGTCKACGGDTSSGGYRLCVACGDKKSQCQACLKPLKTAAAKDATSANPPAATPPKPAIVKEWKDSGGGVETQPKRIVVKDPKEWETVWSAMTGNRSPKPETPQIDFGIHMIIAVFMGERSTGGYSVAITDIADLNGKRVVTLKTQNPPPDAVLTQALTSPYHVVLVPKTSLPVGFVDAI